MKHICWTALFFSLLSVSVWGAPIEFFATVQGDPLDGDTSLTVMITDSVPITILVTGLTEIKGEEGNPASIGDIDEGDMVEVEAIFTVEGILALEIEIQDKQSRFELQGPLEGVDLSESTVTVNGLIVEVVEETEIKAANGDLLDLAGLEALNASEGPLWVKVEGMTTGENELLADEIKVLSDGDFARISLEGIVTEFPTENRMVVDIGGGINVLVEWNDDTKIYGMLGLGAFVKVRGFINSELFVTALTIRVQDLCELSPDELEMGFNQTRQVTILLRHPLNEDLVLQLASLNSALVEPGVPEVTIPAGQLSITFEVISFDLPGKTTIEVTLPPSFGSTVKSLAVEVGEDAGGQQQEMEIKWTPRVLNSAPKGVREVRLMLKHGFAPSDLVLPIELVSPSPDLSIAFPDEAIILEGEREVRITIEFISTSGSGMLRATLPVENGNTDNLKIDLKTK